MLTSTFPVSHQSSALFRFVQPDGLQTLSLAHPSNALGPLYALTTQNSAAWIFGAKAGVSQAPVVSGPQLSPSEKRNVHIRRSLVEFAIGIVPDRLVEAGIISLTSKSDQDATHVALEVSDAHGPYGTLRLNRASGLPVSFEMRYVMTVVQATEASRVTSYSEFKQFDSITAPTVIKMQHSKWEIARYILNAPVPASAFREPMGSAAVDELARSLRAALKN